jgi:hypothetical protein
MEQQRDQQSHAQQMQLGQIKAQQAAQQAMQPPAGAGQ